MRRNTRFHHWSVFELKGTSGENYSVFTTPMLQFGQIREPVKEREAAWFREAEQAVV